MMVRGNFLKHIDINKFGIECKTRENLQETKQDFFQSIGRGVEPDKSFKNAIAEFQDKLNPSQDMFVISQQIANTAKNIVKPNNEDMTTWSDTINATVPIIQLVNEWASHLNHYKNQTHVFFQ